MQNIPVLVAILNFCSSSSIKHHQSSINTKFGHKKTLPCLILTSSTFEVDLLHRVNSPGFSQVQQEPIYIVMIVTPFVIAKPIPTIE